MANNVRRKVDALRGAVRRQCIRSKRDSPCGPTRVVASFTGERFFAVTSSDGVARKIAIVLTAEHDCLVAGLPRPGNPQLSKRWQAMRA